MSTLFVNVLQGASALVGARGAIKQGQAVQADKEYNAKVAENAAEIEELEAVEQARRIRIENEAFLGTQVAGRAASNVDISTGSALLVHAETAGRLELAVFENNRERQGRADQARSRAVELRRQGALARKTGKYQAGEALFRGATDIASTRI